MYYDTIRQRLLTWRAVLAWEEHMTLCGVVHHQSSSQIEVVFSSVQSPDIEQKFVNTTRSSVFLSNRPSL